MTKKIDDGGPAASPGRRTSSPLDMHPRNLPCFVAFRDMKDEEHPGLAVSYKATGLGYIYRVERPDGSRGRARAINIRPITQAEHQAMSDRESMTSPSSLIADQWQTIDSAPEGVEILTKIHDGHGERNVQSLVKRNRVPGVTKPMFWVPDGSMYVYYVPTHWRYLPEEDGNG